MEPNCITVRCLYRSLTRAPVVPFPVPQPQWRPPVPAVNPSPPLPAAARAARPTLGHRPAGPRRRRKMIARMRARRSLSARSVTGVEKGKRRSVEIRPAVPCCVCLWACTKAWAGSVRCSMGERAVAGRRQPIVVLSGCQRSVRARRRKGRGYPRWTCRNSPAVCRATVRNGHRFQGDQRGSSARANRSVGA